MTTPVDATMIYLYIALLFFVRGLSHDKGVVWKRKTLSFTLMLTCDNIAGYLKLLCSKV